MEVLIYLFVFFRGPKSNLEFYEEMKNHSSPLKKGNSRFRLDIKGVISKFRRCSATTEEKTAKISVAQNQIRYATINLFFRDVEFKILIDNVAFCYS